MARHRRVPAEVERRLSDTTVREPESVRIRVLGGFRVSVGTLTIEEGAWRLRKAASLVKLLALARENRLHRERVMDLLWPDLGAKAASNNLRGALHVVRRTFEQSTSSASRYLEAQGNQLVLCPGGRLWVDVDAFEEAAATALNSLGGQAMLRGDHERARELLEENLSVLRELEEERNTATPLKKFHVLYLLAYMALNEENDPARAAALWEEDLALARQIGDDLRIGMTLTSLGYAALLKGDYERAKSLCEETLAFANELGSAVVEIIPETLVNLGLAVLGQGDHERARASFEEAMMSQSTGKKPTIINILEAMASLAGARGEATRAARLWGAAEAARELTEITLSPRSGRCTSLIWSRPVLAWEMTCGKKCSPRAVRCRWIGPPSTPSRRRRRIIPEFLCHTNRRQANRQTISPIASARWPFS
jgi:tetratricopeptide (TPR) repeat protein